MATPSETPLCEARGLRRTLSPLFTLELESFALRLGERVAVVGQNGAGKTTLLRVLAGLDPPTAAAHLRTARAASPDFGFLRQAPYLFRGTVAANLAYPLRVRRTPAATVAARVDEMLDLLGLRPFADRPARRISGGEQKRVALGRALIARPAVLFLDEPDAHLDTHSLGIVAHVLETTSATLLLTTHALGFAHRIAERVLHLRDGRVAPGLPLNVLTGRGAGGRFVSRGGLALRLGHAAPDGPLKVMIDPRSLVLSREPLASSMLNQLAGRIRAARGEPETVWLEIDCGEVLTAIVSHDSYERMGLNVNLPVIVSFKANAVEVL